MLAYKLSCVCTCVVSYSEVTEKGAHRSFRKVWDHSSVQLAATRRTARTVQSGVVSVLTGLPVTSSLDTVTAVMATWPCLCVKVDR